MTLTEKYFESIGGRKDLPTAGDLPQIENNFSEFQKWVVEVTSTEM